MKKCIVYIPYRLEESAKARMVRPRQMIKAFQSIGYETVCVSGVSSERAEQIKRLKQDILSGTAYDFLYAEASTEPAQLTDPDHFPRHPFLESAFFRFLKARKIPIGLFYPDIYWKFDSYAPGMPVWKKKIARTAYRHDLHLYEKHVKRFYVPSSRMAPYLGSERLSAIAEPLPPGADSTLPDTERNYHHDYTKEPLKIFYVGGLGSEYGMAELVKAISRMRSCELTICCRADEWEKEKDKFAAYMTGQIQIVHKSGRELEPYFEKADLCSLMVEPSAYRNFAVPYKAFDYISHEVPILASEGTYIGEFVEENQIGFVIHNQAEEIQQKLTDLMDHPERMEQAHAACRLVRKTQSWQARAEQVRQGLCGEERAFD